MDRHDEINWSAVIRANLGDEGAQLEPQSTGHAVATNERLSGEIDQRY